ncbi:MAG: dockerin type I repeat-containing protein [Muribaculaceae bacterium]|nr:dockerin type I repeat-containing protein [Muribaculaceae bacterium]
MKKFLLIAAMAALALGASADGYKIEKVWELQNPKAIIGLDRLEIRQGFGMDGKFYVNSKKNTNDTVDGVVTYWEPTIYEIDENGLTGKTFPGGNNCGLTRDDAGNLIVSLSQFPTATWAGGLRVIDPATGNYVDHSIPPGAAIIGRCDFLGFAKGNMMEDGEIWLTGGTQGTQFSHIAISGGEASEEDSYYMVGSGVTASTSTVINPYTDLNGDDVLLYVTRNDNPKKLTYADDQYTTSTIALPAGKSNTNGMFPFVWDGKELLIYSILNDANAHYMDGFAIAEAGAEAPIVSVPCTTATTNGFQGNWLNAEVDANGVTIYQYFPGNDAGHFTVWRLTKDEPVIPNVYMLGGNVDTWAPNEGTQMAYDEENKIYTLNFTFDGRYAGYNYFGFTNELAENNDQGGWDYIAPFRFGAVSEGDFDVTEEQLNKDLSLTYENGQAFKIPGGEYNMKLNLENMTLYIEKVGPEVLRGDANEDHEVNISDAILMISAILNSDFSGINFANSDVNDDNEINITDAIKLINYVLNESWGE